MSDRRRIAVVAACPLPWPRGTPIRVHRLSEALAARGHDVHVFTYGHGLRQETAYELHRIASVPFCRRYAPGPSAGKLLVLDPLLAAALRRGLAGGDFHLVHAHHYEGLLAALLARPGGLPVVYDAHTLLGSELPTYGLPAPRDAVIAVGRWVDAHLPARADHVVAVSASIRDRLVASGGVAPARIAVIGGGVEAERFRPDAPPTTPPPTAVYAGSLAPFQRVDLLIAAFATARARRPEMTLLVATDDDPSPLLRLARAHGVADALVVEHSGGGDRLPELFARARIAVNPRLRCDGLPQKNLNYLAAGLPVVAFPESMRPAVHGESGLVAERSDPAALGEAVASLIDDPEACRRMGERGRELVRRQMSWDVRAAQVEAVYDRLLRRPSGQSPPG